MPSSPFDNIFSKGKQAAAQVGIAAKIAKIKVEIATQKGEKERHLKNIGTKTYAIFSKDPNVDGKVVFEEVSNELNLIERIEKHIEDLQEEISKLQAEFKNSEGKDYVDASEVKEAPDDSSK